MVVRRALGISAVAEVVTFVLGFANVVIVSRLLKPEEIGIYSVAVSVLGFAHILREFGVSNYLVQASKVSQQQFRAAFMVAILTSWSIAILLLLGREPMANWYKHQGVSDVLLLLSINFMIMPLGTPALSMMARDMQFGRLAALAIVGAFVQTFVTIAAAMAGQSYLSMAWGSAAMILCKVLVINFMRPGQTFILPTFRGLREVVRFGTISTASSFVKELGSAGPSLILGRTLGFAEVAIFSRGIGLQGMAIDRINAIVRKVHFPTFAADLRNGGNAFALYARATDYLVSITGPTLAVLAILADPLIIFMFGPQWKRAVPVATIICFASVLTAPYALLGVSLTAAGRISEYFWAETAVQCPRLLILLSSIWFPLDIVVPLLSLAYLIEAIVAQVVLHSVFGLGLLALLRSTWRALALIPFTALGPVLLVTVYAQDGAQSGQLGLLVGGAATACAGWFFGVIVLEHPMRHEMKRLWARICRR